MTTTQGTVAAIAAVVVFWVVGAYNRLVRLRSELVARFGTVDERYRQRHALLEGQLDLLSTVLAAAAPRLDALRAACRQADAARAAGARCQKPPANPPRAPGSTPALRVISANRRPPRCKCSP